MKAFKLLRTCVGALLVLCLVIGSGFSSEPLKKRLDLFDAQGNHLMFVLFENNNNGKNTSRSVFMSDSTFVRKVIITRDGQGQRTKETSINFNDDTVFSTTYNTSGETKSITIKDQFGVDQLGAPVSYSASGSNDFTISQGGSEINKMSYEYDGQGNPTKISVTDKDKNLLYYGTFSEVGVATPRSVSRSNIPRISVNGNNLLKARFALTKSARVQCELITLSGRRAGVLFSGLFQQGTHQKNVRIGSSSSLRSAEGIYVVVLSIDGIIMARSKQLIVGSKRSGS